VKPVSCRRRQKSLRGLAKWAPAAADTRPGLIPQKTTSRPGARTSGSAPVSGSCRLATVGCRLGRLSTVESLLEGLPQRLAGDRCLVARCSRSDPGGAHIVVAVAVAAGVSLGLAQRSQPHDRNLLGHPAARQKSTSDSSWTSGASRATNARGSKASAGASAPTVPRASPSRRACAPRARTSAAVP
jgi:hypothetical protein